ncbi:MAG: hypothetical protein WC802_01175 [Patescibacteria group bacterium]
MSKFLLLLGPSGVGKSTIIEELTRLDGRFTYISPYMTRPLRVGERNKVSISAEQIDQMSFQGELLVVNELFGGIRYGTPSAPIVGALEKGDFPVLDWPIDRLAVMTQAFPRQLYVVYVAPPSIDVLRSRLAGDGRDHGGRRMKSAVEELRRFSSGEFDEACDMSLVSQEGKIPGVAFAIYEGYVRSLG